MDRCRERLCVLLEPKLMQAHPCFHTHTAAQTAHWNIGRQIHHRGSNVPLSGLHNLLSAPTKRRVVSVLYPQSLAIDMRAGSNQCGAPWCGIMRCAVKIAAIKVMGCCNGLGVRLIFIIGRPQSSFARVNLTRIAILFPRLSLAVRVRAHKVDFHHKRSHAPRTGGR